VTNISDQWGKTHGNEGFVSWEPWMDDGQSAPAPIGSYRANALGLHDTCGNVWEWCLAEFDREFYGRSPATCWSGLPKTRPDRAPA
jgi:formylglycine-generating enzyme required for sulfatase activity